MNISFRNFCFTLNNPTENEIEHIKASDIWQYICWGEEVGVQDTPHLQGYCELKRRSRRDAVKRCPGFERIHLEKRKGTQKQAIDYCRKDGHFWEAGEKKNQGRRSDIRAIVELCQQPDITFRDVVENSSNYQSVRLGQLLLPLYERKRNWVPKVIWIWGDTGLGKSRLAIDLLGNNFDSIYFKSDASKWWPEYDAHKKVILDDFRHNWMSFNEFLTLLDRYPRVVEYKGGSRQFVPTEIVITSIHPPEVIYQVANEDLQQLLRRITQIIHLEDEDSWLEHASTLPVEEDLEEAQRPDDDDGWMLISELMEQNEEAAKEFDSE